MADEKPKTSAALVTDEADNSIKIKELEKQLKDAQSSQSAVLEKISQALEDLKRPTETKKVENAPVEKSGENVVVSFLKDIGILEK